NRLSDGQKISVSRIIRHELYFQSESYHDIAIIVTESAIKFDKTVNIICIPASDITVDQLVGRWSTVLGFGNVDYGGDLSQALKQIKVQIIDTKDCADRYAIGDKHNIPIGIQECMICGNPGGSSDACQGDSGGPMSITLNGVHHLIGIVSFGRKCGTVRIPGVYTNRTVDGLLSVYVLKKSTNSGELSIISMNALIGDLLTAFFSLISFKKRYFSCMESHLSLSA
ncbi:unnamed protein product, partial [Medioppia subpectinata]